MTVELRPLGVKCNLSCSYCYQESVRENSKPNKYNVEKMLVEAEKTNQPFSLFGGEALLVPKRDLNIFFNRGFELFGVNSIQTNGTLIDDEHIEMFKKYNVFVGVSIDGPDELNSLRFFNSETETLAQTKKTIENIYKLRKNNIETAVIITLHRMNTDNGRINKLKEFILQLKEIGIKNGSIHFLEVDSTMKDFDQVLTEEENKRYFLELAEFFENYQELNYSPFDDMKKMVSGNFENTSCIWNRCDFLNTQSVYGIDGDGGLSNCGRTNKEGIEWYKVDNNSYERYISLYHFPQEYGGCGGCRFFLLCGGGCPGEGVDNDLRNKTIHCSTKQSLFEFYESKLEENNILPFTKSDKIKLYEQITIDGFMRRENIPMEYILKERR
jgi:Arylsulfatase regulator (Fe-S oxidoreductase)